MVEISRGSWKRNGDGKGDLQSEAYIPPTSVYVNEKRKTEGFQIQDPIFLRLSTQTDSCRKRFFPLDTAGTTEYGH